MLLLKPALFKRRLEAFSAGKKLSPLSEKPRLSYWPPKRPLYSGRVRRINPRFQSKRTTHEHTRVITGHATTTAAAAASLSSFALLHREQTQTHAAAARKRRSSCSTRATFLRAVFRQRRRVVAAGRVGGAAGFAVPTTASRRGVPFLAVAVRMQVLGHRREGNGRLNARGHARLFLLLPLFALVLAAVESASGASGVERLLAESQGRRRFVAARVQVDDRMADRRLLEIRWIPGRK